MKVREKKKSLRFRLEEMHEYLRLNNVLNWNCIDNGCICLIDRKRIEKSDNFYCLPYGILPFLVQVSHKCHSQHKEVDV